MRLWNLPGALRFIEAAGCILQGGDNLLVRFPGHVPSGFGEEVAGAAERYLTVCKTEAFASPFEGLRSKFGQSSRPSIRGLRDLANSEGFRGRLIWIEGMGEQRWPVWRDFLSEYAQICRSIPLLGRTIFFVPLAGTPPGDLLPSKGMVNALDWDGILDEIDFLLLAHEKLRHKRGNRVARSLFAAAVARVAAWDFDTAERLLAEGEDVILAPTEMLRSLAREKGWTDETALTWGLGTASREGVVHPARAALDNPPREIERRLWSAQAAVLLPWIESVRHDTVEQNLSKVRREMRRSDISNADPHGLEIGELSHVFANGGADREIRRVVRRLSTARNALAHLRPLAANTTLRLIQDNE